MTQEDCGHLALIASGEARGLCPLCLRAEIERLQGHMRALADTSVARDTAGIFKGLWQGSERECEELRAEIERLTSRVASLTQQVGENVAHQCHLADALHAGSAEIERLEAALRYISELDDDGEAPGLARAALEPKP